MKHVLVIDDDADVLELLAELLQETYRVTTALSAEAALSALIDGSCTDCIVLDLMMPAMSGEEFAQELAHRGVAVPFVVVSGRQNTARVAAQIGACGFLVKPFTSKQLIDAIEHAIVSSPESGASPAGPAAFSS